MDPHTAAAGPSRPEIVLLTKPECHLCEDARSVVAQVAAELGLPWTEQSVVDRPELLERFSEEIPVLMVDGIQRDFWTIDGARLRRLLTPW